MSIEHPTATDLWSARTAVSITVAQAHRQQTDADRDLVEKLTRDVDAYRTENARLLAELRDMCAELYAAQVEVEDLQHDVDVLIEERDQALHERDSHAYRSARGAIVSNEAREAVEFSRGLIPTRPQ